MGAIGSPRFAAKCTIAYRIARSSGEVISAIKAEIAKDHTASPPNIE